MTILLWLLGQCTHRHLSNLYSHRQTCLDCGCSRQYDSFGSKPGPWAKERPEKVAA